MTGLVLAAIASLLPAVAAAPYDDRRAAAVNACEAIDPSESQSGLYANPDGYRSYYLRSKCFQDAAVRFRDVSLCAHVRERRALLSSSWGYSPANCRKLVNAGIADDRRALGEMKASYARGGVVLRGFRIERNGNGRDFDILPSFDGAEGHGYTVDVEILPPGRERSPVLIHSHGYYLEGGANVRIFVRAEDIRRRMPDFVAGRRYPVRLTLTYSVPTGTMSAEWSEAFVEKVFPRRERSRSMTREVEFGAVPSLR